MIGGYCCPDEGPPTREILLYMYTRIAECGGIFPGKGKEKRIFIHLFGKREFVKRARVVIERFMVSPSKQPFQASLNRKLCQH